MKTQNIPHDLFAKFFSGEISEKEQRILDDFTSDNTENKKIFEEYQIIWTIENTDNFFDNKTEQALKSVKTKLGKTEKTIKKNNKRVWFRIAASIIVVFGLTYFFLNIFQKTQVQYVRIETKEKIREYKLSDGSMVWLNKNSKIEFPEKFGKDKRIIKMKGEAYFIIAHNSKKPFIVETENTLTEVLGTEFSIKSIDNESNIEIVLLKGKVKFTDVKSNTSELMKPNEMISLNKKNRKLKKETISNINFLSWKTHELDLNGMNLEEIANTLSIYYKIKIKADSSAKKEVFTSTLAFKNEKIENIINLIKQTNSIVVDTIYGEIIFKKK